MKETRVKLSDHGKEMIQSGHPLITELTFEKQRLSLEEGTLVRLDDHVGRFVARGYLGNQNKGIGWVLSKAENEKIDEGFFKNRIKTAMGMRRSFFDNLTETNAFRIFNGEGDGVGGVTIDYLDGVALIQWYSLGIYRFRKMIYKVLQEDKRIKGIYEKKRFGDFLKQQEADHLSGETKPEPFTIIENGLLYSVYMNDGGMIGIFLDQRDVRSYVRASLSENKNVLNTFSYTGAFSIAATMGGAITTSVDVANRSLERTKEHFYMNGFDPDEHNIIVDDVFQYFKFAKRREFYYDTIILDPPSFATTKKRRFIVTKDYGELVEAAISILKPGGKVVCSTNASNLPHAKFKKMVLAAGKASGRKLKIVKEFRLPEDFKSVKSFEASNYLKVMVIRVQ